MLAQAGKSTHKEGGRASKRQVVEVQGQHLEQSRKGLLWLFLQQL